MSTTNLTKKICFCILKCTKNRCFFGENSSQKRARKSNAFRNRFFRDFHSLGDLLGASWGVLGAFWGLLGASWDHQGLQQLPKTTQETPKRLPRGPQEAPERPPRGPKSSQEASKMHLLAIPLALSSSRMFSDNCSWDLTFNFLTSWSSLAAVSMVWRRKSEALALNS